MFDKDGYFDIMDQEATIAASDIKLLEKMNKKDDQADEAAETGGKSLADMIMSKMADGDYEDGDAAPIPEDMDPKVLNTFKKIAIVMKTYRTGKVPKAFKCIPYTVNWEELLFITNPPKWSPHATLEATRIFVSSLNAKMVQRYLNVVLLPSVRQNIGKYKKLNCHLYMAVKKSIFKQGAFFRGFLLPLAEEDCTAREAVIIGSILEKMSF